MSAGSIAQIAELLGSVCPSKGSDKIATGVVASNEADCNGRVFVAIRGTQADGHAYIENAVSKGAVAAVVAEHYDKVHHEIPFLKVSEPRKALSRLASFFSGDPTRNLKVVGITGTNGKTTTHWMVYHLLHQMKHLPLRIGTLGVQSEVGVHSPGILTTPDPITLHALFADALARGADSCVMEASSHALHQARVEDVYFDVGIYTNLTRDHLDYHGDMDSYFDSKKHLFRLMQKGAKKTPTAIVNIDDPYGMKLSTDPSLQGLRVITLGKTNANIQIKSITQDQSRMKLGLSVFGKDFTLASRFIGTHNAYNISSAVAALVALGSDAQSVIEAATEIPQVPGRLEAVESDWTRARELSVFVDYAHSPDALENVLKALREITRGSLWAIFGCGGDRDKGKRPQMAAVAKQFADRIVVTSDNPRTENPHAIIEDILSGAEGTTLRKEGIIEADRRAAIKLCLSQAKPRDIILIAGKGHEDYQIIGYEKQHFSDQEEVRNFHGD